MNTRAVLTLKNKRDFSITDIGTKEFASTVQNVRISVTTPSTIRMAKQPNKWAKRRSDIRNACVNFTDEEISLHECVALTSWESR